MERLALGEEQAWYEWLNGPYASRLKDHIRRKVEDIAYYADAEDVFSEVTLALYISLRYRNARPNSLMAYARAIAKRIVIDSLRRQSVRKRHDSRNFVQDRYEEQYNRVETRLDAKRLLKEARRTGLLSSRECQILEMFHLQELTDAEIARILGMPVNTVKSQRTRAKEKLFRLARAKGYSL